MNAKKPIVLAGFIVFAAILVGMIAARPPATMSATSNFYQRPAPQPVAVPPPRQAIPETTPVPRKAAEASAIIAPVPVPTPRSARVLPVAPPASNRGVRLLLPVALLLCGLGALLTWGRRQGPGRELTRTHLVGPGATLLLCLFLLGCQPATTAPLPPDDYLEQALDWIEVNAVKAATVDWDAVRAEAQVRAAQAQETADTYPALLYVLAQLDDPEAFLQTPQKSVWQGAGLGITAVYPQNIVVEVTAGSPAAEAGVQVGDELLAVNGNPPAPADNYPRQVDFLHDALAAQAITLTLWRGTQQWEVAVTEDLFTFATRPISRAFPANEQTVAYLELTTDVGTRMYPTDVQAAMAEVDGAGTCGWIVDLRRTRGGDLWSYFAALSPILGDGRLGGFVYTDGGEELWRLEDGQVFWADEEREESYVRGRRYELERPSPAVALLIGPLTEAAGELVAVAFQGWGTVRTFGEPTLGAPYLTLHTPLSDGALILVSGALGMDRNGTVYDGPIKPDQPVPIAWQHLGDEDDPVIAAAQSWLATQPACNP